MRNYHMIIEPETVWDFDKHGETRKEYISTHQGEAPKGWRCVGVCGYHDEPREAQKPCIGCVYYPQCGSTTRTAKCDGRKTKREAKTK